VLCQQAFRGTLAERAQILTHRLHLRLQPTPRLHVLDVDVSGGEQDNDIAKWRRMIQSRTLDIIQPDPLYLGGITRTWRTSLMAHQEGIPCIPHSANHGMVTLFALHLMQAIPNPGKYLEYSIETEEGINQEARAMYAPIMEADNGHLHLPSDPGWGVEIHPDWLEQTNYQVSQSQESQ